LKRLLIFGICILSLIPFASAYTATSTTYNVTMSLVGHYDGKHSINSTTYSVDASLFSGPVGNRSTASYNICMGYLCMEDILTTTSSSSGYTGAARGAGGGPSVRGPTKEEKCIVDGGMWVGEGNFGYCVAKEDKFAPLKVSYGWILFLLVLMISYSLTTSELKKKNRTSMPSHIKLCLLIILIFIMLGVVWSIQIANTATWDTISIDLVGAHISPNFPKMGMLIFALFLFFVVWAVGFLIPNILKKGDEGGGSSEAASTPSFSFTQNITSKKGRYRRKKKK